MGKENVYKKKKKFNLGFAVENKLKAPERRYLINKEAATNFLDNVSSCFVDILKKMFEKSTIGSVVVYNASVFNPNSIFVTKKEDLLKNLKLLQHIVKIKFLTVSHADKASIQYGDFLKNDMKLVNEDDDIDRLDDFFSQSWMLEKNIQNSPKLLSSFSLLVMDKLILREGLPKIKLYCNKTSRRIPFLVKELSKTRCWQINFNLILLRLQIK